MGFTAQDLEKMGLTENPDGTYSKKKTTLQPREIIKLIPDNIAHIPNEVIKDGIKEFFEADKGIGTEPYTFPLAKKIKKPKAPAEPVHFKGMNITDVYAHATENNYIFIKRNVPSLKNSKQIFRNKKTGKPFVTSSALCKKYVKETEMHWRIFRPKFLKMIEGKSKPYKIQFFFVRDKHKAFDFGNINQIVLDCMTGNAYYPPVKDKLLNAKHKELRSQFSWLGDDDSSSINPNFDAGFGYDPKMAGVIIRVL